MNPEHDRHLGIASLGGQFRRIHVQEQTILVPLERVQQHVPVRTHVALPQGISDALPRSLGQRRPEPPPTDGRLAVSYSAKAVIEAGHSGLIQLVSAP